MKTTNLSVLVLAILAGCARQPEQIAAAQLAVDHYPQMPCAELIAARAGKQAAQDKLEELQHKAAERDKGAMAVIHIPISGMTGQDRQEDVARGKGELLAINAAIQAKACK